MTEREPRDRGAGPGAGAAARAGPDHLSLVIRTPHEVVFDHPVTPRAGPDRHRPGRAAPARRARRAGGRARAWSCCPRPAPGPGSPPPPAACSTLSRTRATLYTPFAVVGASADQLTAALDRVLATPDSELAARRRLGELEQRIVNQLKVRSGRPAAGAGGRPMAERDGDRFRRSDPRLRTERDLDRLRRRQRAHLWQSLALIGSVGWPIVLLATGGALLGRWLDLRWHTGVHFTLMLLVLGTAVGSVIAYRALREDGGP